MFSGLCILENILLLLQTCLCFCKIPDPLKINLMFILFLRQIHLYFYTGGHQLIYEAENFTCYLYRQSHCTTPYPTSTLGRNFTYALK